jgi:hypothetical protein
VGPQLDSGTTRLTGGLSEAIATIGVRAHQANMGLIPKSDLTFGDVAPLN